MLLTSEEALVGCFRPIDQDEVEPPPDAHLPIEVDDCLAWSHGPRAFLIYRDGTDRRPRGIVFHRNQGGVPEAAAMCEWCHAVRRAGGVKLLSVRADQKKRVGLYLCANLDCVAMRSDLPGPDDFDEGLDAEARRARALRRIADFAARRLF
jgi:hypothetical protein